MRQLFTGAASLIVTVAAFTNSVISAEFFPYEASEGRTIVMSGEIMPGDLDRIQEAFSMSADKWGIVAEMLVVDSPGGSVRAGIELAAFVRVSNISTVVGHNSQCLSMCVLVWAAGNERWITPTSQIGVHSVWHSNSEGDQVMADEDENDLATTADIGRRLAAYGAPPSVVTKMLTTLGSEMAMLDENDFLQWGVQVME